MPKNLDLPSDQPVYAAASEADLEALLDCLNALTRQEPIWECLRAFLSIDFAND